MMSRLLSKIAFVIVAAVLLCSILIPTTATAAGGTLPWTSPSSSQVTWPTKSLSLLVLPTQRTPAESSRESRNFLMERAATLRFQAGLRAISQAIATQEAQRQAAAAARTAAQSPVSVSVTSTASSPPPTSSGSDATDAFTADWYRCVINPESGGRANTPGTGGLFGFLPAAWAEFRDASSPSVVYEATVSEQADAALRLYAANGGFGPSAWNNSANCGKGG